jgi:hypothetical protein
MLVVPVLQCPRNAVSTTLRSAEEKVEVPIRAVSLTTVIVAGK